MSLLIRTLIRKHKDLVRIFVGDWLPYELRFISWKSFAGSFWVINIRSPDKFAWKFFLKFFYISIQIFYLTEKSKSDKDSYSILFRIVTRKAEVIWSGLNQYPFGILRGTIQEQVIWICRKKTKSMIRILIRKHMDLIRIFADLLGQFLVW